MEGRFCTKEKKKHGEMNRYIKSWIILTEFVTHGEREKAMKGRINGSTVKRVSITRVHDQFT